MGQVVIIFIGSFVISLYWYIVIVFLIKREVKELVQNGSIEEWNKL